MKRLGSSKNFNDFTPGGEVGGATCCPSPPSDPVYFLRPRLRRRDILPDPYTSRCDFQRRPFIVVQVVPGCGPHVFVLEGSGEVCDVQTFLYSEE